MVLAKIGERTGEPEKLKKTVMNSLKLAEEKDLRSIALPAINTYIFDI
jgi:O-acetyl-ADP-ribose deacetylase (regulator of RNase III)